MKRLILTLTVAISIVAAFAQVPNEMMYQVMVIHGLPTPQDVNIEIQIRGSQDGDALWKKAFELKGVKDKSVQNLTLEIGNAVNWAQGEYWIATIIDGEEKGCAKVTSIPYAFCAKTANTAKTAESVKTAEYVKNVLTLEELIGTWTHSSNKSEYLLTINEDGTFSSNISSSNTYSGNYYYTGSGILALVKNGSDHCDFVFKLIKISDTQIIVSESDDGDFYTKK